MSHSKSKKIEHGWNIPSAFFQSPINTTLYCSNYLILAQIKAFMMNGDDPTRLLLKKQPDEPEK